MQAVDFSKPGEKKKLIWAAVLGLVAVVFLWWILFGFGSSKSPATPSRATTTPSGPGSRTSQVAATTQRQNPTAPSADALDSAQYAPVSYQPSASSAPDV